jgi:hypothetical protein
MANLTGDRIFITVALRINPAEVYFLTPTFLTKSMVMLDPPIPAVFSRFSAAVTGSLNVERFCFTVYRMNFLAVTPFVIRAVISFPIVPKDVRSFERSDLVKLRYLAN